MLIVDETNNATILESIHVPTVSTHFWVLDLQMLDFTLTTLDILEELPCPSIALEIDGMVFSVPSAWNILILDDETSLLDVIPIKDMLGRAFNAFVYNNSKHFAEGKVVRAVDYTSQATHVNPSLNRHHMLCHPINPHCWVCIAPNDSYNKYLKNLVMGDLL